MLLSCILKYATFHRRKTNRTLAFITFLVGFSTAGICQSTGNITGRVVDSVTKTGVDFATISLFKPGAQSPFNGASANETGAFKIENIPPGEYRLKVEFLGYRSKTIGNIVITDKMKAIAVGTVLLPPAQRELNAVTISASEPVVQNTADKLVYNAAADISSQGGVALDLLRKVPMVSVDIDGNVELQGDANVRFLINGKPSTIFGSNVAEALQAIPASQIKSIEVITSPGAKYDAEGTAGIINIVLKDSKMEGVNGSINLSAGTRLENASLNLNARKGNLGFNAFFSGNDQGNSTTRTSVNRTSYSTTGDTVGKLYQKGTNPFVRHGYQSGFSLDWRISPKDELTGTLGYDAAGNHSTGLIAQDEQSALSSGALLSDILSTRNTISRFTESSLEWSLAYKKTLGKDGQELDFLYTSSYGNNNTDASQVTNYANNTYPPNGQESVNPGTNRETDMSIDYSQPLARGFTLETGVKAVLESIHTYTGTDTLLTGGNYGQDMAQTYSFNFTRDIYAAYVSASFSLFNDFINGKAGIRFEGTHSVADFAGIAIPDNQLWAPSLLVQHKFNKTESIKFAYTYRVYRPDYDDLNPFVNVSDPSNISTGNPLLKNELNHKFELGYNRSFNDGANISVGGFYDYAINNSEMVTFFYPVYTVDDVTYDNVSLTEPFNIAKQVTYGPTISASVPITSQLNVRNDVLFKEFVSYMPGSATQSALSYKVSLNASYLLPQNLVLEAFGSYLSRRQGYDHIRPAFFFYTFALRKQLLDKKLSFGLVATNPFSPYVNQLTTQYGTGFSQNNLRQIPLRSFGISIGYKFGKLKVEENDKDEDNVPPPLSE